MLETTHNSATNSATMVFPVTVSDNGSRGDGASPAHTANRHRLWPAVRSREGAYRVRRGSGA
eukprot:7688287-Pyramimonas_sp.AAC.1